MCILFESFLVRDDEICVSYIRKKRSKSGKTLILDRWNKYDVTGKMNVRTGANEFKEDLYEDLELSKARTALCNGNSNIK